MARVIAVTPNPALDLTVNVEKLRGEETHRIETATRRLGGKGINVASIAAEQGYPALALGPLSESDSEAYAGSSYSPGSHILPLHHRIERRFSPTPSSLRSTWVIHENASGTTYILNEPGRRHPAFIFDDILSKVHSLSREDEQSVVVISGSFPPATPHAYISNLIDAAHSNGARAIVDTSGDSLREACLAKADLLKPNAAELSAATGLSNPRDGAEALLSWGARAVLTSLGPKGLLLSTAEQTIHARLDHHVEGNPTGAGDAVVAAAATGITESLATERLITEDLLRRAIAWSAAAVACPFAGEIGTEWANYLDRVILTPL